MELAALIEDCCEFVVWGGSDLRYPWGINYMVSRMHNHPEPGDVFIRSSTGQVKYFRLEDFQANWFMVDTVSENGYRMCALVEDTLELVRWQGTDWTYPYWFIEYMFEYVDAYPDGTPIYIGEDGVYVVVEGDIFARNRHEEIRYYNYKDFVNDWAIVV